MDENVKVILIDNGDRLNNMLFILDNENSKIGNFDKDMVLKFREKIKLLITRGKMIVFDFGNKILDIIDEYDIKFEDEFDEFVSKVSDGYDIIMKKMEQLKRDNVSSFDKLEPMLSDDKMKEIGTFIDDDFVGMREFKLEDYDDISVRRSRR